jgi:hypothetical protein
MIQSNISTRNRQAQGMIVFGKTTPKISSAPFLIKTEEQAVNEIRFIIALPAYDEKDTGKEPTGNSRLDNLLEKAVSIREDPNNLYEIVFENYVFHMTRNESFSCWDDYEIRQGDYFILFDQSRVLDYLPHIVEPEILNVYHPEGYKHYGIYCQNHIIDIVSAIAPKINKL